MKNPRIIVALDFNSAGEALSLADRLHPELCRLKVGKELFTAAGPQLVEKLIAKGFDVFLDLKFHDIPNTVASACKVAHDLGVWMVNVHALGGRKMLQAARSAIPENSTRLIAVTLLTSMDQDDLEDIGLQGEPAQIVGRLARLASDCALDGVVCSALEATHLRQLLGKDLCLVTPGIRLSGGEAADQKRITTPQQAIQNGSDYLVIGRPITQATDPLLVCQQINSEIACFQQTS
ncbi:orotidine-5'-phosphate decarboxylase [Nitrosomonas sp. JL21]|uniref:orotidine-5'-phosphate decarboxylase n=1 Tax=Nitrosomonas sp. JL21 TaxID=153949 RepID=UPI0013718E19|nr:orotidine-5'-phosphate decarboxylase [Nitrosomonas sp. JL21]MBL8498580.1 orotidine-5'-phosphate decarboxylase [Nitrosomonas sp.]MCC7091218.1 orotidine-5'-phosphate decarboxylase [Nitrosomonas sp.]MXS78986.1 orotidine-5'-phosphate decarboxylase [Nitrosomonas sp. JL21]